MQVCAIAGNTRPNTATVNMNFIAPSPPIAVIDTIDFALPEVKPELPLPEYFISKYFAIFSSTKSKFAK